MKIQPIQQPTFQMKWESKALPNVTKSKIELANGKKVLIRNGGWYKLQSLYDEFGKWVESKLRFYKGRQVVKEMRSSRDEQK